MMDDTPPIKSRQSSRSKKTRMVKSDKSERERHRVHHDYHDHALDTVSPEVAADMQAYDKGNKGSSRGGVNVPFPTKLHVMLSKVEEDGLSHIISWKPHGRCFIVHMPKEFVTQIMPVYFRQSKLTSFQRQLNLYGFRRLTAGPDRGGYYHELFLKHKLFLVQNMARIRIKGTGIKGRASPETEPDFYSMPPVVPEDVSTDLNLDLEGEVAAAIQVEFKRSEPTKRQSKKRQAGGSKKKQDDARKKKPKHSEKAKGACSSPRAASEVEADAPFAVITPDSVVKEKLSFPASFTMAPNTTGYGKFHRRLSLEQLRLIDLCPTLTMSESEDNSSEQEPHSGDEIAFEGQHFHYLDSIAVASAAPVAPPVAPPPSSFTLMRKSNASMAQHNGIASHPFPQLLSYHSQSSAVESVAESIRGPILTPSSSSSSFSEFQQDENLEINPDTIFSEKPLDGGWEVGGQGEDVDIDAEFAALAGK